MRYGSTNWIAYINNIVELKWKKKRRINFRLRCWTFFAMQISCLHCIWCANCIFVHFVVSLSVGRDFRFHLRRRKKNQYDEQANERKKNVELSNVERTHAMVFVWCVGVRLALFAFYQPNDCRNVKLLRHCCVCAVLSKNQRTCRRAHPIDCLHSQKWQQTHNLYEHIFHLVHPIRYQSRHHAHDLSRYQLLTFQSFCFGLWIFSEFYCLYFVLCSKNSIASCTTATASTEARFWTRGIPTDATTTTRSRNRKEIPTNCQT